MEQKGNEDCYDCDDDNEEYYSTSEDDDVCQSDSEYGGSGSDDSEYGGSDGSGSDGEDVPAMETNDDGSDEPMDREKGYDFETEDDVRRCQDEVTARISELLSVPPGFAAAFLRHCRWDAERLQDEWFADEGRVRCAVGLTEGHDVPTALSDSPLTCSICFDRYAPGETRSAGCSHFYCQECWRGYIRAAVGDGSRCLLLRCPDPRCAAPVVRELVDAVAADEDRARYAMFVVRSYVEEGTSKYVRWCPGTGCTLAVRSRPGSRLYEVTCACKHVFCFRCGEEAHRPASCETTREWMEKNNSDVETSNWVVANTKHCPKCRRTIEKNMGCNHMTCGAPCGHEFCWLCLGSWADHAVDYYSCNRYAADLSGETRRERAKASLEKYLHYYERWTMNGASGKKARRDLNALVEGDELEEMAADVGAPATELEFVKEAYACVVECRRVLRWSYVHVYSMDPDGEAKLRFCEYLQGDAEQRLEDLHKRAEEDRRLVHGPATLAVYRESLVNLTSVTRGLFAKLVVGFEDGMAEVVA